MYMSDDFNSIIKKPTFRAALHKGLNFILSGKIKGVDGFSVVQLFRINDIAPLIYSKDNNIGLKSSFPSYEALNRWAQSNGFFKEKYIERNVRNSSPIKVGCRYRAFYGNNEGITLLFCRQDAKQSEYSSIGMEYFHSIIAQNYQTQKQLESFYDSWSIIISEVLSLCKKGIFDTDKKQYSSHSSLQDLTIIKNHFDNKNNVSHEGLKILDSIIEIDHLKYKKSCASNEWILMIPCYAWVNRRVGHQLELKLKNNSISMGDIGNFNAIELIKLFSSFYPEDKSYVNILANDITDICMRFNPDNQINSLVKSEIERILND